MAIKYAIKQVTPDEDLVKNHRGIITNRYTYADVPQAVAESDWDNGVSAIFNVNGKQVSSWVKLHNPMRDADLTKTKPNPPMPDCLGSMLTEGDYVLTSFGDGAGQILCRVIGFTAKFVKVHNLEADKVFARDPSLLVQVHKSIITD